MSVSDKNNTPDLPRINRIGGQMTGVKKMIQEQRSSSEILTQLRAIRAAIKGLEASILERHLTECIDEGLNAENPAHAKEKIEELKDMFKRYED